MRSLVFLLAIAISAPLRSHAEEPLDVYIKSGVHTGQTYMQSSYKQRIGYAAGLLDGIFLSPLFGGTGNTIDRFQRCAIGMSDTQLAAILDKFLNDNPGRWHQPMHILGYSALLEACKTA